MSKNVDDYVAGVSGWQQEMVVELRRHILASGLVEEELKWGQPIYSSSGPVCLIKAHKAHVTLGFWRGSRLRDLEERLELSGGAEMALIKLAKGNEISAEQVQRLVAAGSKLNQVHGDPMKRK